MTVPFVPTPLSTPLLNPSVGSSGAPPIPYISNSEYIFAPSGVSTSDLSPGSGPAAQVQSLADTIRRASRWADSICFGLDFSDKGASLAASLTIDSATIRIKSGELRLMFDYRPVIEVVGVAVGGGLGSVATIDPTVLAQARWGRRTLYIPYGYGAMVSRSGDQQAVLPGGMGTSAVYAVWSYVNGYPHTSLAQSVTAGATTCVVNATDGNGGLWGVFGASSPFPGTQLTVTDGSATERIFVQDVTPATPSAGFTTLTTSAFLNAHTVPPGPDFIPVSAIPEDVHQAVISLTTMLIKTRGVRGLNMPATPGGPANRATKEKLGQAGALEDWDIAHKLLCDGGYAVRVKHPGSY